MIEEESHYKPYACIYFFFCLNCKENKLAQELKVVCQNAQISIDIRHVCYHSTEQNSNTLLSHSTRCNIYFTYFDQHSFLLLVQAVEFVILMLPLWSASPFSLVLENLQTLWISRQENIVKLDLSSKNFKRHEQISFLFHQIEATDARSFLDLSRKTFTSSSL